MWVGLWVEIVEIFGTEFKNISIKFVNIGWPQVMRDHAARLHQTQLLQDAAQMVDAGKLKPVVDRVYPLAEAGKRKERLRPEKPSAGSS